MKEGTAAVNAFPCRCGGHFRDVIDTRSYYSGRIRRRRVCRSCDRRLSTEERPVMYSETVAQNYESWIEDGSR